MTKPVRQNLSAKQSLSTEEYRVMMADQSRKANSKYGNEWTWVDGIAFQSKAEARYYGGLKMRKLAGLIKEFRRQVVFEFNYNGILITTYRCDFEVENLDGTKTIVDVKGSATEYLKEFQIKKNLMKAFFNITILIAK